MPFEMILCDDIFIENNRYIVSLKVFYRNDIISFVEFSSQFFKSI